MDALDRKILSELQRDGRLSVTELAERVGLSLSPCHRRVKALEANGAIRAYRAQINPASVGLAFSSLVFVTFRDITQSVLRAFEEAVIAIPEITEARRLFGDPDFMLEVMTKDLPAYQKLYDDRLTALPGVQRLTSTLIMKDVVRDRMFPL
ncbi:Lrp/AsnC family transcriptional regulator [Bombella sp. TMW 2.2543]|uniref:Lrp/AsnC family transcriptional regulator n=1 Tax=Bombella pluederhausensis TaxID=2967336 RepID=A0ABT3WHM6_9PROT|nr:Lrp/AsnC family transcriptional regulator [Bombella pluederhausensis]MCX5617294.1 Lrp/AsnC family transcriptional regulator [Bombella pluederhausensis]